MVKTANFTVYEKFFRKQRRKNTDQSAAAKIRLNRLLNSSPPASFCKPPKVKQDAQAYASASHPVIDYNKTVRS